MAVDERWLGDAAARAWNWEGGTGGAIHIRPRFHVRSCVRPTLAQASALGHQVCETVVQQIQSVGVVVWDSHARSEITRGSIAVLFNSGQGCMRVCQRQNYRNCRTISRATCARCWRHLRLRMARPVAARPRRSRQPSRRSRPSGSGTRSQRRPGRTRTRARLWWVESGRWGRSGERGEGCGQKRYPCFAMVIRGVPAALGLLGAVDA